MEEAYDPELIPKSTLEYASHGVEITKIALFNMAGERVNHLLRGTVYRYSYHVFFRNPAVNVRFGMMLKTLSGIELGGMVSALKSRNTLVYVDKGSHYQVDFHFQCNLSTGVYFLNAGVTGDVDGTDSYLHRVLDAAMFRVVSDVNSRVTGLIDFKCSCHAENISDDIGRSPKRDDNSV
ncbi:MAG: hypothetical protein CSA11_00110 [Chloroflexi bacterium]|nr:MAG: hypothetical protein CSA11_00110 [Chloroflexota bacterium]